MDQSLFLKEVLFGHVGALIDEAVLPKLKNISPVPTSNVPIGRCVLVHIPSQKERYKTDYQVRQVDRSINQTGDFQ